ncbi:winged helix-turn-helix transcriptional regulator, partial [Streptomyces calidiresistens]
MGGKWSIPNAVTKRSYDDACGAAHALDLVGERWALLVVRELLLGPKRYSDLLADLPGISTTVLSHRLAELERGGVVRRRELPPPAASRVYEPTEWGAELEPVIMAFGRWGARSPAHRRDAHLSVNSLVLSLRTNFDPVRAAGVRTEVLLRPDGRPFLARVADGRLDVRPLDPTRCLL